MKGIQKGPQQVIIKSRRAVLPCVPQAFTHFFLNKQVLMQLVTMGKIYSTAHSTTGKKQVLQLDQDCILSSQLVAECPNSSALFLVKRHIQRSSMLTQLESRNAGAKVTPTRKYSRPKIHLTIIPSQWHPVRAKDTDRYHRAAPQSSRNLHILTQYPISVTSNKQQIYGCVSVQRSLKTPPSWSVSAM